MHDYGNAILARHESEADDCATCPYKGTACKNQCERIECGRTLEEVYPQLIRGRRDR